MTKIRAGPGFEPGTSRTQSENHSQLDHTATFKGLLAHLRYIHIEPILIHPIRKDNLLRGKYAINRNFNSISDLNLLENVTKNLDIPALRMSSSTKSFKQTIQLHLYSLVIAW